MKKMKALLAVLTLVVVAVTPMTSFAEETAAENTGAGSENVAEDKEETREVSKTYQSTYTLILPESVKTDGKENDFVIKVDSFLKYNEKMAVSVSSMNNWKVKDEFDNGVPYSLMVGEQAANEIADNVVMKFSYKNNNIEKEIDIEKTLKLNFADATYAGTYTDTLTVVVKHDDSPDTPEETSTTTTTQTTPTPTTTTTITKTSEAAPDTPDPVTTDTSADDGGQT